MSTPQFIPRRERDAARRQSVEAVSNREIVTDGRDSIPPYLAIGYMDQLDRPAESHGVRFAADLVALSTLVSMRVPREIL